MADDMTDDAEMEAVLRRSEQMRRSIRARRHNTTHIGGGSPNSSSPSGRRNHYSSTPLLESHTTEKHHSPPVILEEGKRMAPVGVSKSGVLAQQIHDEFLTCKICLDSFTNPKSLSCLHTFCEDCIESHANSEGTYKKYSDYREFTCPLCRKRTTLPMGGVRKLPDNFLVSSLTEVIDRQKPSKFPFCDICKLVSRKHNDASSKCLDCNKLLCKGCVEQHLETKVTRNHNIFDVEIEKEIECKEHSDEVVRFYCESCETAICILCTFNDHKDHDVAQFSDAVQKYKANIENLLKDCQGKLGEFDSQLGVVNSCDQYIKAAEQKIRDVSIDMIADIRSREKVLIEEIHNLYGPDLMALIEKKNEFQADYDALKGTVQLTELIVKGKDMELLLLKKEVQKKLEDLSKRAIKALPSTASKEIKFVPGMVDMGYIHDSDRPNLSRTRRLFSSLSNDGQGTTLEDSWTSQGTQTDPPPPCGEKAVNTTVVCTVDDEVQTDPPVRASSIAIVHQPRNSVTPDSTHRSRYVVHHSSSQGSIDEESRSRRTYTPTDEETSSAQRRRRRRERAKTQKIDSTDRYSYPNENTNTEENRVEPEHLVMTEAKTNICPKSLPSETLVEPCKISRPTNGSQKACTLQ